MKTKATYVSVWNGGLEITSPCKIDLKTKEVTDVGQVDTESMDLETLDREFIRLIDGTEIDTFNYDGFEYINGEREDE
jgi:hypothetical protein